MNGRRRRCVVDLIAALFLSSCVDLTSESRAFVRSSACAPRNRVRDGRHRVAEVAPASGRRRRRASRRAGPARPADRSATNRAASAQSSSAPIPMAAITAAPSDAPGMATDGPHFDAEHVGVDLLPQRGLGPAVGDHDAVSVRMPMSVKTSTWWRKPNAMASSTARYRSARVCPRCMPGEHAAQIRVVHRALLAEEVRQAKHFGRVRVPRPRVEHGQFVAADQRLEPADQAAAGGHAAVGQPAVRAPGGRRGRAARRPPWCRWRPGCRPAPPSFTSASPGRFTPAAKADRTWSAPPTISAVPARRPVRSAASRAELADPRPGPVNGRQRPSSSAGGVQHGVWRSRRRW